MHIPSLGPVGEASDVDVVAPDGHLGCRAVVAIEHDVDPFRRLLGLAGLLGQHGAVSHVVGIAAR
jgi:hypothetical protein